MGGGWTRPRWRQTDRIRVCRPMYLIEPSVCYAHVAEGAPEPGGLERVPATPIRVVPAASSDERPKKRWPEAQLLARVAIMSAGGLLLAAATFCPWLDQPVRLTALIAGVVLLPVGYLAPSIK